MVFSKKRGLSDAGRVVSISVEAILPNPDQPRCEFEPSSIRDLAASIMRYGMLQPIAVRRTRAGYELISGERRLRAAKLAGLGEVPCVVLDVNSAESSVLALVENIQRRSLGFIDEAEGLLKLMTVYGFTREEAARRVGLTQSAVSNKLRILKLPKEALRKISENGLTERHARALIRLESSGDIERVLDEVILRGLNVSQTEEYIESLLNGEEEEPERVFILKDVRLFLNTVERGVKMMQSSGIDARFSCEDTETGITLTVVVPKKR